MVEIPEHLLQRSKSARERLTGQTPSTDSPSEAVEPQEAAQSVETNSPSETPTKQIEEIPVVEDAPYVNAAKTRKKSLGGPHRLYSVFQFGLLSMSELSNGQQLKLQVYSNMVQKYTHNAVLLAMVRMVEVVLVINWLTVKF